MTENQKKQIEQYRQQGFSYTVISRKMSIPINSIKTYCKRHGFGGIRANSAVLPQVITACEYCGMPVKQNQGRKQKRFCSDKCRNHWWNTHMKQVQKRANYNCICKKCGKLFISYGNRKRKYCSHACYISDRFGGIENGSK